MKRFGSLLLLILLVVGVAFAQDASLSVPSPGAQSRTMLILPFENTSKAPGIEWIGEAFVEVLADRMASPSLYVIPRQDRIYAFDRSSLPVNSRPSRATLFRIGEQMDADYMVLGSYDFDGQTFTAKAQLLDMKRLHLSPDITESGPLIELLQIQQALAWDLLRTIDPSFHISRERFMTNSPSIRLDAFENYIRGVVATSRPEKIKKFKEAVRLNPNYTMAIMQLGKTYFASREYDQAASWFARVPRSADEVREASFYAGLSYYYLGQYDRAATAFSFLATQFPLTEVYNNLGVVEARRGRRDALEFFQKACKADPNDPDYHFNLALAFYRAGNIANAASELKDTVGLRPNDAEAQSLLDQLSSLSTAHTLPTPAAPAIAQTSQPATLRVPYERIKRNYDESSFRQLALEIQNATELRLANASPHDHAAYHVEHGMELLKHGFISEAAPEFREAIQLEAQNPAAHAGLAAVLESANDEAAARKEADAANRIKPQSLAFVVLGRLDLRDNNLQGAAQNADRALALSPSDAAALQLKRNIAAKLAEGTQPPPKQ